MRSTYDPCNLNDYDDSIPDLTSAEMHRAELRAVEILAPLRLGDPMSPFRLYDGGSVAHPRVARAMRALDVEVEEKNRTILEDLGDFAPRADPQIDLTDDELAGWQGWEQRSEPTTAAEAAGWLARQIFEHHQHWKPPNPWHTLRPWQSDETVDPSSHESRGRLGDWPARGQAPLYRLCCAMQYLPLWKAVQQIVFHHEHDGHYEQHHHWLLFMETHRRFGGDGPFVVARGSLGQHGTTFTVGHSFHSDSAEEGCFEVVRQCQTLREAEETLLWLLPEGDPRFAAATACAQWSGGAFAVKTQLRYLLSLNPDGRQYLHTYEGLQVRECSIVVEPHFGGYRPRILFHVHRRMLFKGFFEAEHVQHSIWCDEDPDPVLTPIIIALAAGEMRGRYETDTAHALFWSGMVMKPGGLQALAAIDRFHAEFYAVRGWEGAPCPACHRIQPMRTERQDGEILTRRCTVCDGHWQIDKSTLLESAITKGFGIPVGSGVSK